MTAEQPASGSRAADILRAWERKDEGLLHEALERAERSEDSAGTEAERFELLAAIAHELRFLADAGRMDDGGVYLDLLRHLSAA